MVWKGQQSAPVRPRLKKMLGFILCFVKICCHGIRCNLAQIHGSVFARRRRWAKGKTEVVWGSLSWMWCKAFVVKIHWLNGGNYTWAKVLISLTLLPKIYVHVQKTQVCELVGDGGDAVSVRLQVMWLVWCFSAASLLLFWIQNWILMISVSAGVESITRPLDVSFWRR